MNSRWSGIMLGAIVCVWMEISLMLLGLGTGFAIFPAERIAEKWSWIGIGLGSAVYLGITLAVSFFVGGFISSRIHVAHQKGEICFQGLGTWGFSCSLALLLGLYFFSFIFKNAGHDAEAVVALEAISRTNPEIVTDFSLFKGKAVTSVNLGLSPKRLARVAEHEASKPEAKQVAEKARKATATLCLTTFFGLLVSALASTFGAVWGRPTALSLAAAPASKKGEREAA